MSNSIAGRSILLAVGGGVAAYKTATLCSRLVQAEHHVRVIMTPSASQFLGTATMAALSGRPVVTESFDPAHPTGAHIELCRDIDLMVIAPATANLIANLASGAAPDLVSTTYLQNESPVMVAPAMSHVMWSKPAVQRNVEQIRRDGCHIIGPESGWLACRRRGEGRMSEAETIFEEIQTRFRDKP